jgi:hypothetical protein
VGQKNKNQSDESDILPLHDVASNNEGDSLSLTSNERLIIRNFRVMKRSVQLTFVDISEELALTLPATRPPAGPTPVQGF